MKFNLLYSLLYFSLITVFAQFLLKFFGVEPQLTAFTEKVLQNPKFDPVGIEQELQKIFLTEEFQLFKVAMVFFTALLFPMNIGFMHIYQKYDNNEPIEILDFFHGYDGINFFKYFSYAVSWGMIYNFAQNYSLLAVVWILGTLFVAPLLFFRNERLGIALVESFKAFFRNFVLILICGSVALAFKFSGILLLVGFLFTFPFWNPMIYALYKVIFPNPTPNP